MILFLKQYRDLIRHARIQEFQGLNASEIRVQDRKSQSRTYSFHIPAEDVQDKDGVSSTDEKSEEVGYAQETMHQHLLEEVKSIMVWFRKSISLSCLLVLSSDINFFP